MEGFTAVLEVKESGGWERSGPIPLRGDDTDTAREVALDFLADRQPEGDYRLRVWCGERPNLLDAPAVTVGPNDVRCAQSGGTHVLRAGRRRHRTRVTGPVGEVVPRVRLDEVALGSAIWVTTDRRNTAAAECAGPWFPAADRQGAVRATVRQSCAHMRDHETVDRLDFVLSVGEMVGVRPDRTAQQA
ncbi:hypothetical protein [Micromonospora chalcea]|uniref:hypothetical protein n=1 Tax=Micromonospora chalcea TaxID=1874 RepID=UPI003D74A19A